MSGPPADLVLPVDKPEGPTSHDVVSAARKALGVKRIGHTGTLDPFASGLLLLCVGRATRLAEYFSGLDKTYEAVARLGVRTDTLDREGAAIAETDDWKRLNRERIEAALEDLRGEIDQVPPVYSAKKVGGERAYARAREGMEVELEPCRVTIRSLEITSLQLPSVGFRVTCSSGTYVRSLARDIGEALGVGAHLTALRRTSIGGWRVEDAIAMDELGVASLVAEKARAPLEALGHLPRLEVDDEVAGRLSVGQAVPLTDEALAGLRGAGAGTGDERGRACRGCTIAVAHAGALLAVGEAKGRVLRPRKVFAG